jgi:hypothetical protein
LHSPWEPVLIITVFKSQSFLPDFQKLKSDDVRRQTMASGQYYGGSPYSAINPSQFYPSQFDPALLAPSQFGPALLAPSQFDPTLAQILMSSPPPPPPPAPSGNGFLHQLPVPLGNSPWVKIIFKYFI